MLPCCGIDGADMPSNGCLTPDGGEVTCRGTSGGVQLTDEVVDGLAAEAEAGYPPEKLAPRQGWRTPAWAPLLAPGPPARGAGGRRGEGETEGGS